MKFVLFLSVPLLAIGFAAWSLVRLLPLEGRSVAVGTVLLTLLLMGLFAFTLAPWLDALPMPLSIFMYQLGNTLFVGSVYFLVLVLALRLLRLLPWFRALPLQHSPLTLGILIAVVAVLLVGGYCNYQSKRRVPLDISVPGLQQPVRIVMVSDLHLGYHNRTAELRKWVQMINDEHPDAVVIVGDLLDHSMRAVWQQDMAAELRQLQAPVFMALGNHEYIAGLPQVQRFLNESNITLLRDSVAQLGDLYIIGRDDRMNRRRKPLQQLTDTLPQGASTILLDHQPYDLAQAEQCGITLQLSGHTHRGQFWPGPWLTDMMYELSHGYMRKGNTHYYVSSGLGIWGAKVRIGTQSEYVVIELDNH